MNSSVTALTIDIAKLKFDVDRCRSKPQTLATKATMKLWRSCELFRVSTSDALPSPVPLAALQGRTVSKAAQDLSRACIHKLDPMPRVSFTKEFII